MRIVSLYDGEVGLFNQESSKGKAPKLKYKIKIPKTIFGLFWLTKLDLFWKGSLVWTSIKTVCLLMDKNINSLLNPQNKFYGLGQVGIFSPNGYLNTLFLSGKFKNKNTWYNSKLKQNLM